MNSRSIALGASVIVLALAGPGRAEAGTLGQLGTELPDTDVAVQVKAGKGARRTVSTRRSRVAGDCSFRSSVTFRHRREGNSRSSVPRVHQFKRELSRSSTREA